MGCSAAAGHAQMYTMGTILRHGSVQQKAHFLPKIASGELRLQAFGVTEPTTGSDTTQIKTKAEKTGDGYVINGQKVWTSRAQHSDLMLLLARTTPADQVEKKTHGISTFLIDLNEAQKNGCTITPIDAMINHNTCEVFFDNVPIPASALIGEEGRGFRYILRWHECRALPDRSGGHRQRSLLRRESRLTTPTSGPSSTARSVKIRVSSFRLRRAMPSLKPPT